MRSSRKVVIFFSLNFFLDFAPVLAADYYVDGAGGSDDSTGTSLKPFASVHRALRTIRPGDTIHVLPTVTYTGPFWIATSGAPGAPITLQGEGGAANLVKVLGSNSFGIQVAAAISHIRIQGFDVVAPGDRSAIYISPGATHVVVNGNRLHDSGGSGVVAVGADYVTISNNVVFGNGYDTTSSCGSGISLYQLRNSDASTATKNFITGNVTYLNSNQPGGTCNDSDGNGIIVDDSRNSQRSAYGPYTGGTLIANNVAFRNGGRGIHIYNSDNITVVNNTLYWNNQDRYGGTWQAGDITLFRTGSDKVLNNIIYSDGLVDGFFFHVGISIQQCQGGAIVVNNNVLYNARNTPQYALFVNTSPGWSSTNAITIGAFGHWNVWGDPLFRSASPGIGALDFAVRRGSPAITLSNPLFTPPADIIGAPAPRWPTAGAYEAPVN